MAFSRPLLLTFTVLASTAITAEAGLSCGGLNYDTLINVYGSSDVPCADLATNVSDLLATQFICVDSFGRGGGGGFLAMEKNETSVAIALNKIAGDNPDKFGVLGDGIKHPGLEYRENDSPFFFISDQTGGSEGFYGIGVNDDAICEVVANALNMLATTPATTPAVVVDTTNNGSDCTECSAKCCSFCSATGAPGAGGGVVPTCPNSCVYNTDTTADPASCLQPDTTATDNTATDNTKVWMGDCTDWSIEKSFRLGVPACSAKCCVGCSEVNDAPGTCPNGCVFKEESIDIGDGVRVGATSCLQPGMKTSASTEPIKAGAKTFKMDDVSNVKAGDVLTFGTGDNAEDGTVASVEIARRSRRAATPGTVTLKEALKNDHAAGTAITWTLDLAPTASAVTTTVGVGIFAIVAALF